MKFSFDAGEYRDRLANDLREKRAEGKSDEAKEQQMKEASTLPYAVAEAIKRSGGTGVEQTAKKSTEELSKEPSEIATEVKIFKDAEGSEHLLQIKTFDINHLIPEKVKLHFDRLHLNETDKIKLALLEERVEKLPLGKKLIFNEYWRRFYSFLSDDQKKWADKKRIKFTFPYVDEAKKFLTDEDLVFLDKINDGMQLTVEEKHQLQEIYGEIFGSYNSRESLEEFLDEYVAFLDKITDGDFSKKSMLSHTVSGFGEASNKVDLARVKNRVAIKYRGDKKSDEEIFDVFSDYSRSSSLWFHAGGAEYATGGGEILGGTTNLIVICDGESKRLQKEVRAVNFTGAAGRSEELEQSFGQKAREIMEDKKQNTLSQETLLQAFYQTIGRRGIGGELLFKQKEPWVYIAKWIVDAYHGRLYRINEIHTPSIEEIEKIYEEKFKSVITDLKAKMSRGAQKLPEYLASGGTSVVFRIEVDKKKYVAKFLSGITRIDQDIKPLLRAKGIPHTAQIVTYSLEDSVIIMEPLPGKNAGGFTPEEAPASSYSDDQIIQLIELVINLDAHGLGIDPNPDNFMYDQSQGFFVLDYHLKESTRHPYEVSKAILDLRFLLTERNFESLDRNAPDYKEKVEIKSIEKYKFSLPLLIHFIEILQKKYPDILAKWQKLNEEYKREYKKNPPPPLTPENIRTWTRGFEVPDLVNRRYIPKSPVLEPYLQKLEEMGFETTVS